MTDYSALKAAMAAVIKTNGVQAITGAVLQTQLANIIDGVGDDFERLLRDLGFNAAESTKTLTAGETGKYVKCSTRAATANANFNISSPFSVDACDMVLVKTGYNPSDENHASLDISVISIYEEMQRVRTVQATDGGGHPLYYEVDEDGNPTTTQTTEVTPYPVYTTETYTETRYLPNNEDRFVAIPDSGYYVANIPQSCKLVVSYKPGVTDTTVYVVKHGTFANLTSQLLTVFEKRVISEALADLDARLKAIESAKGKLGIVDAKDYRKDLYPLTLVGAGAPAAATVPANLPEGLPWDGVPVFIGQQYVDTTNSKVYVAKGFENVSDWLLLN